MNTSKVLVVTLSILFSIVSASFADQQLPKENEQEMKLEIESEDGQHKTTIITFDKDEREKLIKEMEEELVLRSNEDWQPGTKTKAVVAGGALLLGMRYLYNYFFSGNVHNVHGESASGTTKKIEIEDIRGKRVAYFEAKLNVPPPFIFFGGSTDTVVVLPQMSKKSPRTYTTTTSTASQESVAQEQQQEQVAQQIERELVQYNEAIRIVITNPNEVVIEVIEQINGQLDKLIVKARTDIPMNHPIRERILAKCYIYKLALLVKLRDMQPQSSVLSTILDVIRALHQQIEISRDSTLEELANFCFEVDHDADPSSLKVSQQIEDFFSLSLIDNNLEAIKAAAKNVVKNDVLQRVITSLHCHLG